MKTKGLSKGQCSCAETLLWNASVGEHYRVTPPRWHSCNYIRLINKHVVEASATADKIAERCYPNDAQIDSRRTRYMQEYAGEMNLARANVLAKMGEV